MKFWEFADRNSEGLLFLAILCLCYALGTCGDGRGCRVRVGGEGCKVESVTDAGAP